MCVQHISIEPQLYCSTTLIISYIALYLYDELSTAENSMIKSSSIIEASHAHCKRLLSRFSYLPIRIEMCLTLLLLEATSLTRAERSPLLLSYNFLFISLCDQNVETLHQNRGFPKKSFKKENGHCQMAHWRMSMEFEYDWYSTTILFNSSVSL